MRVSFVISSLGIGGAERVCSMLANYWAASGWEVHVATLDDGREPPFYPLRADIRHTRLGVMGQSGTTAGAMYRNLRRVRALRRALRAAAPEVVISFMDRTNVLTLLATAGLRMPVIVSERTDPAMRNIGRS
jgi:UDP-N-acetylglucosamine:LPS N-acetylglucosamine transferase